MQPNIILSFEYFQATCTIGLPHPLRQSFKLNESKTLRADHLFAFLGGQAGNIPGHKDVKAEGPRMKFLDAHASVELVKLRCRLRVFTLKRLHETLTFWLEATRRAQGFTPTLDLEAQSKLKMDCYVGIL